MERLIADDGGAIGTVNLSEVLAKLVEAELRAIVEDALVAASLRPLTRRVGLSLGDRACLALAIRLGLPAATADRAWVDLAAPVGVEVRLVRGR